MDEALKAELKSDLEFALIEIEKENLVNILLALGIAVKRCGRILAEERDD